MNPAVLTAYGFSAKKDLLAQLLALNQQVAAKIEKGEAVVAPGLPKNYPDAKQLVTEDCRGLYSTAVLGVSAIRAAESDTIAEATAGTGRSGRGALLFGEGGRPAVSDEMTSAIEIEAAFDTFSCPQFHVAPSTARRDIVVESAAQKRRSSVRSDIIGRCRS